MLKEALEQSGVAGLIGWTDSNNDEDNVLGKALVSNLTILTATWLTEIGSSSLSLPASDHTDRHQSIPYNNPLPHHFVHPALDLNHRLWPLLLQLHPSDGS